MPNVEDTGDLSVHSSALFHDPRRFFQIVIEHANTGNSRVELGGMMLNEALMAATRIYRLGRFFPLLICTGIVFIATSGVLFGTLLLLKEAAPAWLGPTGNLAVSLSIGLFALYHLLSSEVTRTQDRALAFYNSALDQIDRGLAEEETKTESRKATTKA